MQVTTELQVGDVAPDFTAVATDGSNISLHDYKGKQNVVLYFYPKDFTGGCTKEAQCFRDDIEKFKNKETVILGVSRDDQETHQKFSEKERLNFPLLDDKDGKICTAYGVPLDEKDWPERWTYLINKDGKIAKIYKEVHPLQHSQELLEELNNVGK